MKSLTRWQPFCVAALGSLCLLVSSGCQQYFCADTVLHSDGSIDRLIVQPIIDESPLNESDWDQVAPPERFKYKEGQPHYLSTRWQNYIVAEGHFASVDDIPDHYQLPSREGSRPGLKRSYTRTDLVLVTEHSWQEVLTESVDLNQARRVAKELIHLGAEHAVEVLSERYGDEYDFSGILNWADGEGVAWFAELYDALIESSLQPESNRDKFITKRFVQICEAHGLKFQDEQGRTLGDPGFSFNEEQMTPQWIAFLESRLIGLIRRTDGQPVPREVIEEILEEFDNDPTNESSGDSSKLQQATEMVIQRRYGSAEQLEKHFEEQIVPQLEQVFGAHLTNITPQDFSYSMKMPGVIMETNGILLDQNEVNWQFDADSAFPSGKTMSCISLESNIDAQKRIFGQEVLTSRESRVQYRQLVADPMLLEAMQKCAEQSSAQPLGEIAGENAESLRELLKN